MAAMQAAGGIAHGRPARTRVLFLNTATQPPLGADTWIHAQIMRRLDRDRHEVVAACAFGPKGRPTPTYGALRAIPDLELMPADLGPELGGRVGLDRVRAFVATVPAVWTVLRLVVFVRRRDIDIIHTSDRPRDAFVAAVLSRLTPARSIVHVHVTYHPDWMGRLLREGLARADALIAISTFVARSLIEHGITAERVHVARNAIDIDAWRPGEGREATRAELGIGPEAPVLLTICRLFPEKGPLEIIEALARVHLALPDAQLLIVGTDITPDAWFSAALRHRTAELHLDRHVRFLGRRQDIEGLLAAADVFVMPSFEEPFGLVFCEAMAMERPVVALESGGTSEVVEHGRTGLLSEPGDLDALASNLITLLGDPARQGSMGAAGRQAVREHFVIERMAADVASVYAEVVCGPRSSIQRAART